MIKIRVLTKELLGIVLGIKNIKILEVSNDTLQYKIH